MDKSEYQQAKEHIQLCSTPELPKISPEEEKRLKLESLVEKSIMAIETQFEPLPSDIILVSYPKTGTTWLKALTSSILNISHSKQMSDNTQVSDLLLTHNPHQIVPFLELECFGEQPTFDITKMTCSPRLFSTHMYYSKLPGNIKSSGCKMVYITRNPMDTFISLHFFSKKVKTKEVTLEEDFVDFCRGVCFGGPYFDNVLEYWRACNERPEKFIFLTYEELKEDPNRHVTRVANFIGCLLDPIEIEKVVERCSFDRLSNLGVNRDPSIIHWSGWDFTSFFRKGVVNDWKNYLTPKMVGNLTELAKKKWEGAEKLKFQLVDRITGSSSC